ncbi:hypothetical protein B0H13DRAFT_1723670 [Mycena leptocephala]|nr:hypothetical protein B0H13DRAFT_1112776 [Mycena leptocephala]KAJ7872726.1 hypothetical protein B0H13DRAFT_1723670 [Mycena leptocephala]
MSDEISHEVVLSWSRLQTVKYVNVASMAILVFDYCLTFHVEASLIWPSRMSFSKTLFMLARYTPFFDVPVGLYYILTPNVPLDRCFNLNVASTAMSVFGIAIGEAILILRTYALSGRERRVLIVFSTIYLIEALATVILISLFLRSMTFGPPILAAIPGCNETGGNFILVGICFIIVLLNETVLMGYTLWLGYKKYRHFRSPFIMTLYRDGITYFIFLFLGSAANFTILLAGEGELQELLNTFLRVMHSVLSSRVLLNVRDVERKREEGPFRYKRPQDRAWSSRMGGRISL